MSLSDSYLVQKGIYEKLINDSSLMSVASGVFDYAPHDAVFPFISFGDFFVKDYSCLGCAGYEYNIEIYVWSREGGKKQAADISDIIYGLLHNGNITVSGKRFVFMRIVSSSLRLEDDGFTYRAAIAVRLLLVEG